MRIVGLTGGMATGKSTVSRLLVQMGIPVLDADVVSRDVTAPNSEGLAAVVQRFGPDILTSEGALDRSALRVVVLGDPQARADLEAITHPRIREAVTDRLQALAEAGAAIAVVEAALLVETGGWRLYDALLVVSCAEETQLQRIMERDGHDEESARRWQQAQLPIKEKERVATAVVWNDGDIDALPGTLDAAWTTIKGHLQGLD